MSWYFSTQKALHIYSSIITELSSRHLVTVVCSAAQGWGEGTNGVSNWQEQQSCDFPVYV